MKTLFLIALLMLTFATGNAAQPKAACPCGANCTCTHGKCGHADCPSLRAATIVVQLPADAVLLIDGNTTKSTGSKRTFRSPSLPTAKEYEYTLTASVIRNGRLLHIDKTVTIRAGKTTETTIELPEMPAEMFLPMLGSFGGGGGC